MIIFLEEFFTKVAFQIAKILAKTKITPRQVTLIRFIIAAPLSLFFFSRGKYLYNLIGLFSYMSLAILDWVDGRLAEIKKLPKKTKPLGRLIDSTLDQILMLVVLGSLFYAGLNSSQRNIWLFITILYFSLLLIINTLLYKFDWLTGLEYKRYEEIWRRVCLKTKRISVKDKILWSLLYVRNNSVTTFCFTVSYPLFLGIVLNQLIVTFIFIVCMSFLRAVGLFFIMYKILDSKRSNSILIEVLRDYIKNKN